MKGTIEITITRKDNGVFWTEVEAEHCKKEDITSTALMGAISLLLDDLDGNIPEKDKEARAKAFGSSMGQVLLEMLRKKKVTQRRYENKEAAFLSELMKRQGEVQNE